MDYGLGDMGWGCSCIQCEVAGASKAFELKVARPDPCVVWIVRKFLYQYVRIQEQSSSVGAGVTTTVSEQVRESVV